MLLVTFFKFYLIIVGSWIAAVDSKSGSSPKEVTSACGSVALQECWCLDENACHSDESQSNPEIIPIVDKDNILTAEAVTEKRRLESPYDLDLSKLNYQAIDRKAFAKPTNETTINLADNNLVLLPQFVFSKLTSLERLSLADNGLRATKNVFAGLGSLKTLDLSNNPLTDVLDDNCFYGLTKSCDILVSGVSGIEKIGTNAFGTGSSASDGDPTSHDIQHQDPKPESAHTGSPHRNTRSFRSRYFSPAVCIQNGTIQRFTQLKNLKSPESGCREVDFSASTVWLSGMGITSFQKGWFTLQDREDVPAFFTALSYARNDIVRVTTDVINHLPSYITWVNLNENKIERLQKETMVHPSIFSLDLNQNRISEIEDNTFKMPKLTQLFLRENKLTTTKFASTLPAGLSSLDMDFNEITEITPNSFSNLKELRYLNLISNKIKTVQSRCFDGVTNLGSVLLSRNEIEAVEPNAFEGLHLYHISLEHNKMRIIEKGVFTGVIAKTLSFADNKLTKIGSDLFNIPKLETLDFSGNNITIIEKGAMNNLGNLKKLDLSKNPIKRLENGALFGLNKNGKAYVRVAKNPIEVIQGGLFDDV